MAESRQQAAADGDAGAGDARQKRQRLAGADQRRGPEADPFGVGEVRFLLCARGAALGPAAEGFEAQHQQAVEDQESRRLGGACEQGLDARLEKDAEHRSRDGAHQQQHGQALGIGFHLAANRGRHKAADDHHPLLAVDHEQRGGRAEVEQDKERHERGVGLLEAPVEEARHQHRVAQG